METVRRPAVAGKFYPASAGELRKVITRFLDDAPKQEMSPQAIIVPHAGYIYSGPIAATAYTQLEKRRKAISRVILLGPAHHKPITGLVGCHAEAFSTPLGNVPVDTTAITQLLRFPQVTVDDDAHKPEHCLEVQLPFLQQVLNEFTIVPLLVGEATVADVAEVINIFWDNPENLIVVSSDLSHFQSYERATQLDAATSQAIAGLDPRSIGPNQACGHRAIEGLLTVAQLHDARAKILDVRNSGDTAGARNQVVGYGAYTFE